MLFHALKCNSTLPKTGDGRAAGGWGEKIIIIWILTVMIQKQKINDSNDLWIFKSNTKYLCVERILQVYVFYSSWPLPIHTILRNRILNAYFWHLSPNAMWSAGLIIPIHRLVDRVLDLYGPLPILNTLCTPAALKRGSRGSIIAQFHSTGEFFIRVSLRSGPQERGGKEPLGPLGPLDLVKNHLVRLVL